MKKLSNLFAVIVLFTVLMLCAGTVKAGEIVSGDSSHNSVYVPDNTTITISSGTPTLISSVGRKWRNVFLGHPTDSTVVYYTVDNDSITVTTNGFYFRPMAGLALEYGGNIYLQLADGVADITIRLMTFYK
jgi:hypothetical protein